MNCEVGIMLYVALMFCNGKCLLVCEGLFWWCVWFGGLAFGCWREENESNHYE